MPVDDEIQVGVFYFRPPSPGSGSSPIEMGGGEGNLVRILACHWNFELVNTFSGAQTFFGVALSSNPEHELTPLVNFEDFQANKALYARSLEVLQHFGTGDTTAWRETQIIPVYGLVRPRRQIMVSTLLTQELVTGIGLEVYYQAFSAPFTEREEVNRKYGKYRRT